MLAYVMSLSNSWCKIKGIDKPFRVFNINKELQRTYNKQTKFGLDLSWKYLSLIQVL